MTDEDNELGKRHVLLLFMYIYCAGKLRRKDCH